MLNKETVDQAFFSESLRKNDIENEAGGKFLPKTPIVGLVFQVIPECTSENGIITIPLIVVGHNCRECTYKLRLNPRMAWMVTNILKACGFSEYNDEVGRKVVLPGYDLFTLNNGDTYRFMADTEITTNKDDSTKQYVNLKNIREYLASDEEIIANGF